MSLGTNISRLRAEKRLSQGDLAEVLEVSRQSVSKWETDSSVPDLDKLIKLSQLFGVTLDELVTGAEPQLKVETPPVMVSPSMPGRKIAGIILFCMAFLAFLIPTVLGGILVGLILAVPFLVCGIICFLVRKRPGLWCAWAAYLAVYIFCYYGTRISWNLFFFTFSWEEVGTPVYTFAAWIQSLMILALLIGTGVPIADRAHRRLALSTGNSCDLHVGLDGSDSYGRHRLPHSAGHCLDAVGADGCRLEGLSLLILFGSRPDIGRGVFLDFSRRALII